MTGFQSTLMVSPYAPYRDGIAAYVVQEVKQALRSGDRVEVVSPKPSAAHHHLALGTLKGVRQLTKLVGEHNYDRVVVQYFPEILFGSCRGKLERALIWRSMAKLARKVNLEFRIHEIEYGVIERNPIEKRLVRQTLQSCSKVFVHTPAEQAKLDQSLGLENRNLAQLFEHGSNFEPASRLTSKDARIKLGLDDDSHIFLCIGFVQEHKGFDIALRAFETANLADSEIHVVGSVRVDDKELIAYADKLQQLAERTEGAFFHREFVSDEIFDDWILAADTVVVPYKEIWSSGVIERAKLFEKVVVASDVGGIEDQVDSEAILFSDIDGLVAAMRARVPASKVKGTNETCVVDYETVQQEIRSNAKSNQQAGTLKSFVETSKNPTDLMNSLPTLQANAPVSTRPGVSFIKKLIRKATRWQLDPISNQIDALQSATTEAITKLESSSKDGPSQ